MIDIRDYRNKPDRVVRFLKKRGHVIDVSAAQTGRVVIDGHWRTFPELYDMASQDPEWLRSENEFNRLIVGSGGLLQAERSHAGAKIGH